MSVPQTCGKFAHTSVYLDEQIVVFGGATKVRVVNHQVNYTVAPIYRIWTYKLDTEHWILYTIRAGQTVPPATLFACAAVVWNDIYMFGGYQHTANRSLVTNALWKLHKTKPNQFMWTRVPFASKASKPSPRARCASWEYNDKVWILGGSGPPPNGYIGGHKSDNFIADLQNDGQVLNNQVLCFDPSNRNWSIPETNGTGPPPCERFRAVRIGDKVWVPATATANMYILDLKLLAWVKVQIFGSTVPVRECSTFTAITDTQIAVHGGLQANSSPTRVVNDTQIFDVESTSLSPYAGTQDHPRFGHCAVRANNSVMILGGSSTRTTAELRDILCADVYWVTLEPDRLQKLALKAVFQSRDLLQHQFTREFLAPVVLADLMEMCQ